MPQSRHRKINRARKIPRAPHSNPGVASNKPISNRNVQIGAIILVVIAIAAAAYYFTRPRPKVPPLAEMKIEDIKVGDGESPKMGQTVIVNYTGWLWKNGEQGKEFDSSRRHGKPAEFKLGGVIEGWNQGLSTMKVGGKRILYIPSKLGYGAMGNPPNNPPNSDLKFEVELLGVR